MANPAPSPARCSPQQAAADTLGGGLFFGMGTMTEMIKKRGRPPSPRGAYNPNPPRQLGRVSDADWQLIRDACEASGQSLVEWGLPLLLKEARRKVKRKGE